MEAGKSVGECSFITVVTIEEPEPKTEPLREGVSLGGVIAKEGRAADEDGGSSNTSLFFRGDLSSGPGENPEYSQTLF